LEGPYIKLHGATLKQALRTSNLIYCHTTWCYYWQFRSQWSNRHVGTLRDGDLIAN